eukprot:CAMPEP_0119371462 /NCGR_PEP_ID=MMETSP1334-20130426/17622_1 /TAXON_ID=127549 /ORGANISM="Calcidiscus leptoporus, Strain RCC1130" /LENGTH=121 /DNA_ID=CAMNT_0007388737 /DNA_START=236 /DNA_END=597 /DNA_ORIENTATION=-
MMGFPPRSTAVHARLTHHTSVTSTLIARVGCPRTPAGPSWQGAAAAAAAPAAARSSRTPRRSSARQPARHARVAASSLSKPALSTRPRGRRSPPTRSLCPPPMPSQSASQQPASLGPRAAV